MDAFVAWGDLATVAGRVQDHLDAGADHVALQIFNETPTGIPIEAWRRLVELPEMGHA